MADSIKDNLSTPGAATDRDKRMMSRRTFLKVVGAATAGTFLAGAEAAPPAKNAGEGPAADVLLRPAEVEEQLKQYGVRNIEFGTDGASSFEIEEPVIIIPENPTDVYSAQYDNAAGKSVQIGGPDATVFLINSPGRTKIKLSSDVATTGAPRAETQRVWMVPLQRSDTPMGGNEVGAHLQQVARNPVVRTNILRHRENIESQFTVQIVPEVSDTLSIPAPTISASLADLPDKLADVIPAGAVKFPPLST